ncbi:MAG: hypothetical protein WAJ92_12695 [Candidatus Acidiferrales bacterium]
MRPLRPRDFFLRLLCAISLLAVLILARPHRAFAQATSDSPADTPAAIPVAWSDGVHSLASKIAAAAPSSPVALDVQNISSLSAGDTHSIRQALESELALQGNRPAPGSAVELHVTLSEGADGLIWIAEIVRDGEEQIRIVSVPQNPAPQSAPQPTPELQRKILWQQSRPMLDFAQQQLSASDSLWLVLEPDRLVLYAFAGEAQTVEQSASIAPHLAARDPRGHLSLSGRNQGVTTITAYVGSVLCSGSWISRLDISCVNQPGLDWQIGSATWRFAAPYNYFSGGVNFLGGLGVKRSPFFSAAAIRSESSGAGSARWIETSLDGSAQLFEGSDEPAAKFSNWGSEIASLAPACGHAWQVLATGAGDWLRPDAIQIYEVTDDQAVAIGQPLDFPGPVLALWPSDDGNFVRVVSRNLSTGMYEASTVSIVCNR